MTCPHKEVWLNVAESISNNLAKHNFNTPVVEVWPGGTTPVSLTESCLCMPSVRYQVQEFVLSTHTDMKRCGQVELKPLWVFNPRLV